MATARKAWFKVADSIIYEGWDDNMIATMIRLCAHLNTRWAREGRTTEEAGITRLSPADIGAISGRLRLDVARKSLERLANVTGMSVELDGKFTRISWPKYAIFQGLTPSESPDAALKIPPPQTQTQDAHSDAYKERAGTPSAGVSRSPKRSKKPQKTICPDRLDPADRDKLLAWADTRDFTNSHVVWAFNAVKDWSQSKAESRADWVATIRNAMRDGWALKGYAETASEKYQRELAASPLRAVSGGLDDAS